MTIPASPRKGTDRVSPPSAGDGRRAWQTPRVDELPRLTELTLQTTAGPIIGGTCLMGATCF